VRTSSRSPFAAALLGAFALLASGCLHEPDADVETAYQPIDDSDPQLAVRRDVTMSTEEAATTVPVLAASPRDHLRPDPVPFRIGAGHGALGSIDLAPCRAQGLPPGYLRIRVTFRHDGRVAHAVVEGPTPPPQEALDCLAEQLDEASVPVFDGRDASLSRRFFVEPGGTEAQPEDTVVQKGKPPGHKAVVGAGLTQR
jgi:hypothetical protein